MISVVIPTHNRSDMLQKAVESVEKQSYADYEIIIVSDGSTDDTDAVVAELSKRYGNIQYVDYYPPRGGNVARNTGIAKARGEYIAFLDDDDEWMADKLKMQMDIIKNDSQIGLVYTGVQIIYANENIKYDSCSDFQGDLSNKILIDNYIGTTSTVLVKKELFEQCGDFDIDLGALQDYEMWIRICQNTQIGVVDKPMVLYYNYRNTKQVSSNTQKYEDSIRYIEEKHNQLYQELSNIELKQHRICMLDMLYNKALRNNNPKKARDYVKQRHAETGGIKNMILNTMTFFPYEFILILRSRIKSKRNDGQ